MGPYWLELGKLKIVDEKYLTTGLKIVGKVILSTVLTMAKVVKQPCEIESNGLKS